MFDLFKTRPKDVKGVRNTLLLFIKEQLQKYDGGEGSHITGLYLFIYCQESDKHLYEAAVINDIPGKFKNGEVQKIADDYAIELPASWTLEISFTHDLPPGVIRSENIDVALLISTFNHPLVNKDVTAYINILSGEASKDKYMIKASQGKITIGRGASIQTPDGFFRKNMIAFADTDKNTNNRAVSRQHAHIEWDPVMNSFFLYADSGGIPPNNKLKVRPFGGAPVKLTTIEIGHQLHDGDQAILGESAVIEFSLSAE